MVCYISCEKPTCLGGQGEIDLEKMVSIILLVCCSGIFVYGIMYAFLLQCKKQNITRFDILEPFKPMSAFKAELKFLLPIFTGLDIISYFFGDYNSVGDAIASIYCCC
jgi:hypothetical protein